jgi:tetratricopeptide (TPR) repeat protein
MRAFLMVLLLCLGATVASAEDADPLYVGRDLLDGAERERGVTLLRGVIAEGEAAPRDAKKQQRAGRAHMYLDEDDKAVTAMERALALEPENVRFAFWVGAAWLPLDVDKSVAAFEKAVALDPADADAWFGLGKARDRKKDLPGSLAAFEKTVALDPGYLDAHYLAGTVLQRLDRSDEAITYFRKALEVEPENVGAGRRLGQLEYAAGRFEKALAAWLAVEPHAPDDIPLRAQIVQALFALGRHAEAEPWREKVRQIHAAAKDEKTRALKEFCFDQFKVDDKQVVAYEQFDRSEEALYRYVFYVSRDGKRLQRVNLEPGPVAPGLGILGGDFFLGANDEHGHVTFDKKWESEPPYPELKAAVIEAIRGKVPVATSSRRSRQNADKDAK